MTGAGFVIVLACLGLAAFLFWWVGGIAGAVLAAITVANGLVAAWRLSE